MKKPDDDAVLHIQRPDGSWEPIGEVTRIAPPDMAPTVPTAEELERLFEIPSERRNGGQP